MLNLEVEALRSHMSERTQGLVMLFAVGVGKSQVSLESAERRAEVEGDWVWRHTDFSS